MDTRRRLEFLIDEIRRSAARAEGLLVPVSGGSDSALGFWLCTQALPGKTHAIHAGDETTLRCLDWYASVGPLGYVKTAGRRADREEMRWAHFLSYSLRRRQWLVSCRNRTEDELGTYSLASRTATFMPLVGSWKSDVMKMCGAVGVPEEIIASSSRADPDCGRPLELAVIPLHLIDGFVKGSEEEKTNLAKTHPYYAYLAEIMTRNAFKKTLPIRGTKL